VQSVDGVLDLIERRSRVFDLTVVALRSLVVLFGMPGILSGIIEVPENECAARQ
jgi:hypothetical protein